MYRRIRRVALVVGAVTLLAGGTIASRAMAQTPSPGAAPSQASAQHENYRQVFLSKLATLLGVDQQKLSDSLKQAAKDTVDQAVKNGDLTQKRADSAKARIDQGRPGPLGHGRLGVRGRGKGHMGAGNAANGAILRAVADKLGMTVADLQSQMKSGRSLADIAQSKGVSEQDLRGTVVAALKPRLDEAVKSAKLTQQREDAILQRIQRGQWPSFHAKKPAVS